MSTIKDVARRANVAISTVSNILNGTKYVSDEVVERVMKAIKDLDYKVDPVARRMKSAISHTIGAIITDTSRIFFPPLLRGATTYAADFGYKMMIVESNDDITQEKEYINIMSLNRFDGIILDSVVGNTDREYYQSLANLAYRNKRTYIVSIERNLQRYGIDSVVPDNYGGARTAVGHLHDHGCRKFMHIRGPNNSYSAKERVKGFNDRLDELGIGEKNRQIVLGDFSPQSGYNAIAAYSDDRKLQSIDGIFTSNDQMAVGAIKALTAKGLRVPDDIKVIGFDDTFVASIVEPSISTVHVASSLIGQKAMELLLKRINNPGSPAVCFKIETKLVVRKSTDPKAGSEWELRNW